VIMLKILSVVFFVITFHLSTVQCKFVRRVCRVILSKQEQSMTTDAGSSSISSSSDVAYCRPKLQWLPESTCESSWDVCLSVCLSVCVVDCTVRCPTGWMNHDYMTPVSMCRRCQPSIRRSC